MAKELTQVVGGYRRNNSDNRAGDGVPTIPWVVGGFPPGPWHLMDAVGRSGRVSPQNALTVLAPFKCVHLLYAHRMLYNKYTMSFALE